MASYPMQCGTHTYDYFPSGGRSKKYKKKTKGRKTRRHDSDGSMSDSASSFDEITYPEDEDRRRRRSSKCPFGTEGEEIVETPDEKGLIVKRLYEGPRKCKCCTNWQREPPEAVVKQVEKTSVADHALTVYHSTVRSGDDTSLKIASVAVRSDVLKNLLKLALKNDQLVFVGSKPVRLLPPFKSLYHSWDDFNFYRKHQQFDWSQGMATARDQAKALFEIVKPEIDSITKDRAELVPRGLITYDLLWTLYPPGCNVFCDLNGTRHIMTHSSIMEGKAATTLTLTYRDWNAYDRNSDNPDNLVFFDVPIQPWTGTRQISELTAVPCDLEPQRESIIKALAERGRRASGMTDGSCYLYKGMATCRGTGGSAWVDGRIIIDEAEYRKTNTDPFHAFPTGARPPPRVNHVVVDDPMRDPFAPVFPPPGAQYDEFGPMPVSEFSPPPLPDYTLPDPCGPMPKNDFEYAQCRSVVRGFSLDTKSWLAFEVDNISDMVWNDMAFEQLVMSNRRKRLIHALVDCNQKRNSGFDDFIKGKGKGLIMLLQGAPGTGKTLTAQSIADKMHLPLYTVHASELQSEESDVERDLKALLQRAEHWNAVLLIDEADAFLETRDDTATKRSKRVAVFLRQLEHFSGIMILTTNRPIHFDEAFHSRIDITLGFADLDESARTSVWKNFLRSLENNVHERDLKVLARAELNGRQIKNTVKMASLLAENEGQTLCMEHFSDVFEVMNISTEEGPRWPGIDKVATLRPGR